MASVTTHDFVDIRAYDGSGTPNYINVTQYGFPSLPGRRPIPPTEAIAGGGKVEEGNIATIIRSQLPMLAPVDFDFTFNMESEKLWQLDAFGNPREKASWTVGTSATVWAPVTNIGTVQNIKGQSVSLPLPIHTSHVNYLFNLEVRASVPANAPSGVVYVHRLLGCACNSFTWNHQEGELSFTLNLSCFGQIDTKATAFTAGTATT
jgi:hypothetical protein